MGGMAIRNMRRMEAALRGERLDPEPEPEMEEGEGTVWHGLVGDTQSGVNGEQKKSNGNGVEDEWQDMDEYMREAGDVEVGEFGNKSNAVTGQAVQPDVQPTDGSSGNLDREARKIAKKAREQQRKRQKEENKRNGGERDGGGERDDGVNLP